MKKLESDTSSKNLAFLICDALVDAKVLTKKNFEKAIAITIEEIDVRKALTDYWCEKCSKRRLK